MRVQTNLQHLREVALLSRVFFLFPYNAVFATDKILVVFAYFVQV